MTTQAASSSPAARPAVEEAPSTRSSSPEVSVIVPIRNAGANVWPLVFGLRTALGTLSTEVLFIDDSDDETPTVVKGVAELMSDGRSDFRVRLLHRDPARREGGRAGAVDEGLSQAEATYLIVMDSDLQHRPSLVPTLLDHLRHGADVVIPGTRAEQDLDALPGFFGMTREALTATTLNVTELP